MKALICPQCGANIDLDDTREFGFCTYCGAKIQLVEKVCVEHTGSASINCSPIVENLCKKGFISIDRGDFSAAAKDFEKASEYDCEDTAVIIGKMLVSADDYYNLLKRKYPEISECEKNRAGQYQHLTYRFREKPYRSRSEMRLLHIQPG